MNAFFSLSEKVINCQSLNRNFELNCENYMRYTANTLYKTTIIQQIQYNNHKNNFTYSLLYVKHK
jgi:hypothetical protein